MEIILIRQGLTEGSKKNQYIGSTDEPLCFDGKLQLMKAQRSGFYPETVRVYSSPMRRCIETCQVIYPKITPEIIEGFRDKSYGRYEGKAYPDLKDDEPYQAWVRSCGKLPFPDGDSDEDVKKRTLSAFDEAASELRRSERIHQEGVGAAFVLHGGSIMTILSERLTTGKEHPFRYSSGAGDYFRLNLTGEDLILLEKKRFPQL